jgi:Cation efflux family
VFASLLLTGTKGVVGMLTGSLAILSEAAHSAPDMVAALLTYFAMRAADKPADQATISAMRRSNCLRSDRNRPAFPHLGMDHLGAIDRLRGGSHRVEFNWYANRRHRPIDRRRSLAIAGAETRGRGDEEPSAGGGRAPFQLGHHQLHRRPRRLGFVAAGYPSPMLLPP